MMKALGKTAALILLVLIASIITASASSLLAATTLYFDAEGGTKPWDYSTANWSSESGGDYNLTWSDDCAACFEGIAGTVEVSGKIDFVESILFSVDGYTISGGTIELFSRITTSGGYATISTEITGSTALQKFGDGTLILAGENTHSGVTIVKEGNILLANSNALQYSTVRNNGIHYGTLTSATFGGLSGEDDMSLTNDDSEAIVLYVGKNDSNTTYEGTIFGSGSLTKIGDGFLEFTASNTYSGGTIVNGGVLRAEYTHSLPQYDSLGKIIVNDGGTLRVRVGDSNFNRWTTSDIVSLLNNATFNSGSTLSIYVPQTDGNISIDTPIDGNLGISTLCNAGTTLTLSANNSYTGSTVVLDGILKVTGSLANNGSDKVFVCTWNPDII